MVTSRWPHECVHSVMILSLASLLHKHGRLEKLKKKVPINTVPSCLTLACHHPY